MTMPIHTITTAAALGHAGRLIATAFHDLDATRYLVPDPARRHTIMSRYFTLLAEHATQVLLTGDGDATAILFDHTHSETEPVHHIPQVHTFTSMDAPRFAALETALDAHHPTAPHWHLAFLAVHPDRQHSGLGTALLTHIHHQLDTRDTSGYLEATNVDNIRLYQRHGYHPIDPLTITVGNPPGPQATFHPMWRPTNPARPTPQTLPEPDHHAAVAPPVLPTPSNHSGRQAVTPGS